MAPPATATDRYFGVDVSPAGVVNSKAITWYDSDLPELANETGGTLTFANVPQGLTVYKAVKFRVTGCRTVNFRITGLPTGAFGLTTLGSEFVATADESAPFYYGYVWIQLVAPARAVANSSVDIHAYLIDQEGYYATTPGGEYPLGDFHIGLTATTVPRENNSIALVLAGTDLDPRGLTGIGGGILQGAAELGLATHTNRSMLVLTDGNENVHPYVGELPAGTITNRTYAIGFGLPADVSTPVLQQITSNTHGDLIITGDISTVEQGFTLTKYFVQVLAGVTNMNVVADPQGSLFFGSRHAIPFTLTDADVYADVITLCPLPQLIDFVLETPSGKLIKPTTGAPNVRFTVASGVAFYRVALPALAADPAGSRAGTWKAILSLKTRDEIDKLLGNRRFAEQFRAAAIGESLPYSLVAHVYSNLQFEARLHQDSLAPGANVTLAAALKAFAVPFTAAATVWAEVTAPDASTANLRLDRTSDGTYAASFTAPDAGVYTCRVRAEGYFHGKDRFTREKTLTAAVYRGDHSTAPPNGDPACELLHCLTSDKVLSERVLVRAREFGVDLTALKECMKEHCPDLVKERIVKPKQDSKRRAEPSVRLQIRTEKAAQRIKRPAPAPPNTAMDMAMPAAPVVFPRIIHMFTHPDELAARAAKEAARQAAQTPPARVVRTPRKPRRPRR